VVDKQQKCGITSSARHANWLKDPYSSPPFRPPFSSPRPLRHKIRSCSGSPQFPRPCPPPPYSLTMPSPSSAPLPLSTAPRPHPPSTAARPLPPVTLYAKGEGGARGACPLCQRVHMVLWLKARLGLLRYEVVLAAPSLPPAPLKARGLSHLPAITHGDEGFDAEDDIVAYLDQTFPSDALRYENSEADNACKDFFSKFCFFLKSPNQDSSKLDHAFAKLNAYIEACSPPPSLVGSPIHSSPPSSIPTSPPSSMPTSPPSSTPTSPLPSEKRPDTHNLPLLPPSSHCLPSMSPPMSCASVDSGADCTDQSETWLCGSAPCHLDCSVLPKLHHARVAAAALRGYTLPRRLHSIWRYLHTAYGSEVFRATCPSDQAIILHWHDRTMAKRMTHKERADVSRQTPRFSFDVPVTATAAVVLEDV